MEGIRLVERCWGWCRRFGSERAIIMCVLKECGELVGREGMNVA